MQPPLKIDIQYFTFFFIQALFPNEMSFSYHFNNAIHIINIHFGCRFSDAITIITRVLNGTPCYFI